MILKRSVAATAPRQRPTPQNPIFHFSCLCTHLDDRGKRIRMDDSKLLDVLTCSPLKLSRWMDGSKLLDVLSCSPLKP